MTHDVRSAHEELAHSKAQTAAASAAAAAAAAASAATAAPERLPLYRQQQPLLTQQQQQQQQHQQPPSAVAVSPPPPPPPLPQLLHHDEANHLSHHHRHHHHHNPRDAPTQQQATLSRPALEEHYRAHPECQPHGAARAFFSSNPLDGLVRLCASRGCVFRDHDFDTDAVDPVLAACAGGGGVVFRRLGSGLGGGGQPPLLPASGAAPAGDEIDWGPTDLARWVVGCVAVAVQEFSAQGREAQRDPASAKSMGGARFMVRPREANGHGVYTVRLFVDDAWRYVVVDDRVPCSAASGRPLLPTVIGGEGPMFLPLVVKALAKLHGGYGALAAAATLSKRPSRGLQHPYGHVAEALCDLSGGAALLPALPHPRSEKFAAPWTARDAAGARGDALEAFCDALWEALDEMLVEAAAEVVTVAAADGAGGLAPGGVYRVLETASAEETAAGAGERSTLRLLRLHAPYGDAPWTGAWAPGSREWSAAPRLAAALCPRAEADGSFWVEFVDLLNSFEYCAAVKMFTGWNELSLSGAMLCGGLRGGGGRAANGPWYQMQVTQACTVFVSVQQRDPRVTDKEHKDTHLVGFKVVAEGDVSGTPALVPSPLTKRLAHHLSHGPQPTYALGMLEAGTYYVVPTCDVVHANPRMQESLRSNRTEVDFTLRVFAKSAFVLVEKQGAPPV